MALTQSSLEDKIEKNLKSQGFETRGTHGYAFKMCQAIAKAVVDEITQNAEVPVTGGSSSGIYKIK